MAEIFEFVKPLLMIMAFLICVWVILKLIENL